MKPKKLFLYLRHYPSLKAELRELQRQAKLSSHDIPITKINPYPHEKQQQSGTARGHYFHQDLLVARRIHANNPEKHVDIGSRVDGFVAHVASFRDIEVLDIRPQDSAIQNIRFRQADLMSPPPEMEAYCDSLSCLHAIEHFGLGRYGDPVDFEGHVKGLDSLYRYPQAGRYAIPVLPDRPTAHRVQRPPRVFREIPDIAAGTDASGSGISRMSMTTVTCMKTSN